MKNDLTFHTEIYKGLTIRLVNDDTDPESPRRCDNLGTMVCNHRRHNLGDKQVRSSLNEALEELAEVYDADIVNFNLKNNFVILPLFLSDHSGITMSSKSFNDRWDSGQVGFIYCSLKKAQEQLGYDHCRGWDGALDGYEDKPTLRKTAVQILEAEVKIYDCWLRGDICGWVLEGSEGEVINSMWGYYPNLDVLYKDRWKDALNDARAEIDYYVENFDYAQL